MPKVKNISLVVLLLGSVLICSSAFVIINLGTNKIQLPFANLLSINSFVYNGISGSFLLSILTSYYLWVIITLVVLIITRDDDIVHYKFIICPTTLIAVSISVFIAIYGFINGNAAFLIILASIMSIVISFLLCYDIYSMSGSKISRVLRNVVRAIDFSFSVKNINSKKIYYILYTIFLFAFIDLGRLYIESSKSMPRLNPKQQSFLDGYLKTKEEIIKIPVSNLTVGENKSGLRITVFTDTLCSACYSFFKIEKYISVKYKGKVWFDFYLYPLDKDCNPSLNRTSYVNSCTASKSLIVSNMFGVFESYYEGHFLNHKEMEQIFIIKETWKRAIVKSSQGKYFTEMFLNKINDVDVGNALDEQIKLAQSLNVNATPTIFINKKRIVGSPSLDNFEAIVQYEIEKLN